MSSGKKLRNYFLIVIVFTGMAIGLVAIPMTQTIVTDTGMDLGEVLTGVIALGFLVATGVTAVS